MAIRPKWPTGVSPFLLFHGLWLECLCLVSPSSLRLFSWCLLSNWFHHYLLKAAQPKWLPDKVRASPGVPPSILIQGSAGSCIPHHLSGWRPWKGPPMTIGASVISLPCGLGNTATLCHPHGSPSSWPVCCNKFPSSQWPALGAGWHNCGCHVDGPLNFPHDQLWVIPWKWVPQTAGHRAVLYRTLR
jgi:hypothetical protein